MLLAWWKLLNRAMRPLAGWAPWWVLLVTTGRRSGLPRSTPLASGPRDGSSLWLLAVHGEHCAWVRNLVADPRVQLRHRGRWHSGAASVRPLEPEDLRRFSAYARMGPQVLGIDPLLVRVDLDGCGGRSPSRATPAHGRL